MEQQELLLRTYLQEHPLPEGQGQGQEDSPIDPAYLEEQVELYQELLVADLDLQDYRDGDRRQEIFEHALRVEELVYTRLGKRIPCGMCPRTKGDKLSLPITEQTELMHLRCGHKIHSHCFFHHIIRDDFFMTAETCPICRTPCVEERALNFFRRNNNHRRANVVSLWETNPTFRTDLKKLLKIRRETLRIYREYAKAVAPVLREYKQTITVSLQAIAHYKKEYKKKLRDIVLRRKMLRGVSTFNNEVTDFTKKYDIYLNNLHALHDVAGAPYIPIGSLVVPWRFRREPSRFLRTVV